MSDLSPLCAPKQTSADFYGFMSSRATPQSKPRCPFRHPATFTKFAKRRCQILRWSTDGVSSLTHLVQRPFISTRRNSLGITRTHGEEDVMERRHFLKLAFGFAAGAAALAASARAAPLMPHPLAEDGPLSPSNEDARPAVTNGDEVEHHIGLGPIGSAVATNLVNKSGHPVTVWNRTKP